MLSHAEAQALVSARLDGPLDPIAARELEAHLATCASCRAFNTSSTQLMRGLRSMPYLPASPAVKRAVIDHIKTSRTPWNVISGPWLARAVPLVGAVAAALLLTILGAVAFQRLNDTRNPIDAVTSFLSQPATETEPPDTNVTFQPTDEATNDQPTSAAGATEIPETAQPTESDPVVPSTPPQSSDSGTEGQSGQGISAPEPTATTVPEPAATPTPEPTATTAPEPTATPTQEPTATIPPEPTATATLKPTATTVPEPTATPTQEPTATTAPEPTATTTPEPTATPTQEPTATIPPEPTATATATPEPTATTAPVPEPTATTALEPTATPTQEPIATNVPEPAATAAPEPTATTPPEPTLPPTEVPPEEPTTEPTEAPNEQIIEPIDGTVVDSDDDEATQEDQPASVDPTADSSQEDDITPDSSDEESNDAVIDPIEGQTPVDDTSKDETPVDDASDEQTPVDDVADDQTTPPDDDSDDDSDPDSGTGSDDDDGEEGVIEPTDGGQATEDTGTGSDDDDANEATETSGESGGDDDSGEDGGGEGIIEPRDDAQATQDDADGTSDEDGDADRTTQAPDDSDGEEETVEPGDGSGDDSGTGGNGGEGGDGDTGPSLGSAQEVASTADIPGDPDARLGINADNSLEFSDNPGQVSLTSNGLTLEARDVETGQAVFACDESGSCIDVTSASAEDSHADVPLGWIGSDIIYERIDDSGEVTFRAVQIDPGSGEVIDDRLLGSGSETLTRPYPVEGGLLVPTLDAWLLITAEGVDEIDDNPSGDDIDLVRIAPSIGSIAYVSGGEIIVASLESPGTPVARIGFSGTDFDLSPDGTQIVVTDGAGIQILDLDGNVVQEFANDEGIAIGGVAWTQGRGIVYVDASNGVVRSIQP